MVQLTWSSDEVVVIATGFCRSDDAAACTAASVVGSNALHLIEIRAYVP
jgi:hypothetical protein